MCLLAQLRCVIYRKRGWLQEATIHIVTAGDNPSPLQYNNTMAGTYYSKNIFTQVIKYHKGHACEIKWYYYLILQVFLSTTKTRYMVRIDRGSQTF